MVLLAPMMRDANWEKAVQVFESILGIEQEYLESYQKTAIFARSEGDEATALFVGKLVEHQVESVSEWDDILAKAKSYSAFQGLLYHLDAELRKKAK